MQDNETTPSPWGDDIPVEESKPKRSRAKAEEKPAASVTPSSTSNADYDIDGLMTDFPTARDLERFVFDETGIVLNLKGRANKLKYQVAMDVLNGQPIDEKFIGNDNPYIDKADLVPVDPIREKPARSPTLPDRAQVQNSFYSPVVPHPDTNMRAQDKRVHMVFRKYNNGMISYEVLGPIEPVPWGEKIDKYGRTRPEVIKMIDPRTGEQLVQREDGTLTPQGKKLRAMMQTFRVNKSNQWDVWIDREFASINDAVAHNPWDLK